MNAAESDLMTVQDVARRLRVAVSTVRRYLNAGKLEAIQLGADPWGPVRISAASLNEALARWTRTGSPKVEPQRGDPMPIPAPSSKRPTVPAPIEPTKPKPEPPPSVAGWN
jgi:excisionase family DNA binding protein